jgi:hypothetical protein
LLGNVTRALSDDLRNRADCPIIDSQGDFKMPHEHEFNAAILDAAKAIAAEWPEKGYDINSYFTHNLKYGPDCCLRANHPPKTMCVAAVTEIIVAALTRWFEKTGDKTPFQKLPMKSWQGGTKKDIRGHIFMYDGFGSNGTAHALERFGIGHQLPFAELQPAMPAYSSLISMLRAMISRHMGQASPDSATSRPRAATRVDLATDGLSSATTARCCLPTRNATAALSAATIRSSFAAGT